MRKPKWEDITVEKFQHLMSIKADKEMEEVERSQHVVALLYDIPFEEIDDYSMIELKVMSTHCVEFINAENIPGRRKLNIKANGKRYGLQFEIQKIKHRQYVELMTYGEKPVENLHKIMASIAQPKKWFKVFANNVDDHAAVANDMLKAKLTDVYHAMVFFYHLLKNSIESLEGFLMQELKGKKEPKDIQQLLTSFKNALDGFTIQNKYQNLKVSV